MGIYEMGKEVQSLMNSVASLGKAMMDIQRRLKFIEETSYMTKAKAEAIRKQKVKK